MEDAMFRILFFAMMNCFIFGTTYLIGRKYHPKLAPWLTGCSFIILTLLCYFSIPWIMASVILLLVYLRILRKPDQIAAFQALYAEHNIYTTTLFSKAALDILGEKNCGMPKGKYRATEKYPSLIFSGRAILPVM
ncbi:MAG: hypothetical protein ABJB11_00900 [Ferruginibacter sp.]